MNQNQSPEGIPMPPKISVYDDYESMSRAMAERVIQVLDEILIAVEGPKVAI